MPVDHWMMFGTFAEQRYFTYPAKDTYKGILLNASTVAYARDGLAAFLLEKTAGVPYLIDPQTHAFQHEPSAVRNGDVVKKSIQKLSAAYGSPVSDIVGKRPLRSGDISDGGLMRSLVSRCLSFQRETLAQAMESADANKYLAHTADQLRPAAVVAPYWFMDETTLDSWLHNNALAVELANDEAKGSRVFAALVLSQGVLLSPELVERLLQVYSALPTAGFLLWVDELDEHDAPSATLRGFLRLARGLRQNGQREVINLHGGYFSILAGGNLGHSAISGVVHGPEYGEARAVVPVGGGIPISRYYVPELHRRVKYREALALFTSEGWLDSAQAFHTNVCNCPECVATLEGDPRNFVRFGETKASAPRQGGFVRIEYPTTDTRERCLKHYLQRKVIEHQYSAVRSATQLSEGLTESYEKYRCLLGDDEVAYLEVWRRVLQS